MIKPGKSHKRLVTGLVLQGIGGVLYMGGLSNSIQSALLGGSGGSSPAMGIGAVVAFIGWLVLLHGVSRASAGIDYLVSVSPDPESGVEGRARESRRVVAQPPQTPPSSSSMPSVSG